MTLSVSSRFAFELDQPTDVLLQFEAAQDSTQRLIASNTQISTSDRFARMPAQDNYGERIWMHAEGHIEVSYEAEVDVSRKEPDIASLGAVSPELLPGEVIKYLLDSRYCPAHQFQQFADETFAGTSGGARIAAIHNWVSQNIAYTIGASTPETNAIETFHSLQGACRDFAHLVVALARASIIPARYVACYAPGVNPPDFHAVAEVFLANPRDPARGQWFMVDATGMAKPAQTARIGIGRDATDVSFMTVFGPNRFLSCSVKVALAECREP